MMAALDTFPGHRREDDPQLVLVPGAWMAGWIWQDMVDRLDGAGVPAHTLTLTGLAADTTPEHAATVGLEQHVEDVLALLDGLQLSDVVLVGHSYSGVIVGQIADRFPERVRRSIHVATFLPRHGR